MDQSRLRQFGEMFYLANENSAAVVLCLNHVFQNIPSIRASEIPILPEFFCLCSPSENFSLRSMYKSRSPKAFGIQETTNKVLYPKTLFSIASSLALKLKSYRCDRLQKRLLDYNQLCREAQAFTPCLLFLMRNHCYRVNCPQAHLAVDAFTREFYNERIRSHLYQIMILRTLHFIRFDQEQSSQRTLRQKYSAFICLHAGKKQLDALTISTGIGLNCFTTRSQIIPLNVLPGFSNGCEDDIDDTPHPHTLCPCRVGVSTVCMGTRE